MRLTVMIDSINEEVECASDCLLSQVFARIDTDFPDYGTIITCNGIDWRLSKKDLDAFTVETIGAVDGDIFKVERVNYNEPPFELPLLGDKMQNLVRSIRVKMSPHEQRFESMMAIESQQVYDKMRNDKKFLARTTWSSPCVARYLITHPEDFGGFLLVYKKWRLEQRV